MEIVHIMYEVMMDEEYDATVLKHSLNFARKVRNDQVELWFGTNLFRNNRFERCARHLKLLFFTNLMGSLEILLALCTLPIYACTQLA